jgi:hypothetical protein
MTSIFIQHRPFGRIAEHVFQQVESSFNDSSFRNSHRYKRDSVYHCKANQPTYITLNRIRNYLFR